MDTDAAFGLLLAATPTTIAILRDMLLVFAAAKLLAELAERLKQPSVVGELIAGIVIGPALLGWVRPNDFLAVLAELAVLFLLFQVGLELKEFELVKVGGPALLVAVLGVVVPFALGYGILTAFGERRVEAIFVGAAMVATSVGITARVLASHGLLDARASKIILAAAVIDDILGLLVLAVVSSVARGKVNVLELGSTAVLAVGFTLAVARWGTLTMEKITPHVQHRLRAAGGEFTLALILLFSLSLAAVHAGVAAIVGAFLAGMALANSVGERVREMVEGVTELLVPFFLVGIGLHLELSAFRDASAVALAGIIVVAACLSKFIGCGLGAFRLGWADATRIGVGMIPRGEVGMVVAQIGLGLGVIPPATYGLVVFMSIATTMVAPPLLKLAYRDLIRPGAPVAELPRVG